MDAGTVEIEVRVVPADKASVFAHGHSFGWWLLEYDLPNGGKVQIGPLLGRAFARWMAMDEVERQRQMALAAIESLKRGTHCAWCRRELQHTRQTRFCDSLCEQMHAHHRR